MNYKPLDINILVKQDDDERQINTYGLITNVGGITHKKPECAVVVCMGDNVVDVSIGDVVFFSKYAGIRIEVEKEQYLLLSRNEVFGINNERLNIKMGETKDLLGVMENIGQLVEGD